VDKKDKDLIGRILHILGVIWCVFWLTVTKPTLITQTILGMIYTFKNIGRKKDDEDADK
jgi:F0F1-type ATP synthase assembly protein I